MFTVLNNCLEQTAVIDPRSEGWEQYLDDLGTRLRRAAASRSVPLPEDFRTQCLGGCSPLEGIECSSEVFGSWYVIRP
jgi:hypothetical protein